MADQIHIVHYLNQFFGGVGGEDKADLPLQVREGPVGPGVALERACGGAARVVATVICGDNLFVDKSERTVAEALAAIGPFRPHVFIAGPAFNSGRYGLACARLSVAVQEQLRVPALTGMHAENPGLDFCRQQVYVVPTAASAAGMQAALVHMARLGTKLAQGQPLGPAAEEGYLPRGVRLNAVVEQPAAVRAVDMLLAKLSGAPYETELALETFDVVTPPPPLADLSAATIALVTEAGIVPKGNPDRIESTRASKWARYSITGTEDLNGASYESVHGGYDSTWANQDPDRVLPLDALRSLEREGVIGKLFDSYFVTVGNGGNLRTMRRLGSEIAQALKDGGVHGVVLPAT